MFDKIDIPIKIGRSQYYIGSDRYNFILGRKQKVIRKKKGKDIELEDFIGSSCTYYSSLEALLEALQKKLVKAKTATTLLQLQKNITKSKKEVMDLYRTLTEEEIKCTQNVQNVDLK